VLGREVVERDEVVPVAQHRFGLEDEGVAISHGVVATGPYERLRMSVPWTSGTHHADVVALTSPAQLSPPELYAHTP
jgi:hypothetical protein